MEDLREAIEYIADLGHQARSPRTVEIGGVTYGTSKLVRLDEPDLAAPIRATTLTGMVDYINDCSAEIFEGGRRAIIQIMGPTSVELYSSLNSVRMRETLFACSAKVPNFVFDRTYSQEAFCIALQSCFIQDYTDHDDLKDIQMIAANITTLKEQEYSDDGVTQQATIRKGITTKADYLLPNRVVLRPYRTFLEVEQPESPFVFRISQEKEDKPMFKLIEADGGAWKNKAMQSIREYFEKNLDDSLKDKITIIA